MDERMKRALIALTAILFLVPMIPPAGGDGMPVYTYVKDNEEARELYGTTFESRQLANVEYLNSTHQRIDLFLSIFSLDPRENLTVLVPFRQVPVEVNMEKGNDTDFLDRFGYTEIKKESGKQDVKRTSSRFAERTGHSLQDLGTSAVSTPLGTLTSYVARTYALDPGDGKRGYEEDTGGLGGTNSASKEVEEIAYYEFDGASVSVYSVSANATLEDFISVVDLGTLPTITRDVVEEYREQYVAVIETLPSPPVDQETYDWLREVMPETMDDLINRFSDLERLSYMDAQEQVIQYSYNGFREMVDSDYNMSDISKFMIDEWYDYMDRWEWDPYDSPFDILEKMESLIFAVYGFTDFQGHTLSVTTSLDEGDLYFPLGTSKGWDNPIQETIIIARVPKDLSLDPNIDISHSAFMEDEHCYIFEYFDANPENDLEASINDASMGERASSAFSKFIYWNTAWAPVIFALIFELLLWFGLLWLTGKAVSPDKKIPTITKRKLSMAVLNLIISAPVAYIFIVEDPFTGKKHMEDAIERSTYKMAYLAFIVINFSFMLWGVLL